MEQERKQIRKQLNANRKERRKITLPRIKNTIFEFSDIESFLTQKQLEHLRNPRPAGMQLLEAAHFFGITKGSFSSLMKNIPYRFPSDNKRNRRLNLFRVFQILNNEKRIPVALADENQIQSRDLDFLGSWDTVEEQNIFPASLTKSDAGKLALIVDPRTPRSTKLTIFLIPPLRINFDPSQEFNVKISVPPEGPKPAPAPPEKPVATSRQNSRMKSGRGDPMTWISEEVQYRPSESAKSLTPIDLSAQGPLAKARKMLDFAIVNEIPSLKQLARELNDIPNIPNYHSLRRLIIFGGFCEILLSEGFEIDQLPQSPNSIRSIGMRPKADLIKIQEIAAEMVAFGAKLNDTTYGLAVKDFDSGQQKAAEQLIQDATAEKLENLKAEILRKSLRLLDTDADVFSSYFAELAKSGGSSFRKICNQTLELQEGKNGGI